MIEIDGSVGEGGGQVLRTSLGLSLVTGQPFRITRIRAGRERPGLRRQHLTAVGAAKEIGHADVDGAAIGSMELVFRPRGVRAASYRFAVGTAGSATLVIQTVLPALLVAAGRSEVAVEGGTHNPFAPPYDFLERTFLPAVNRMGPRVEAALARHGFYPAGGGLVELRVEPAMRLAPIEWLRRGEVRRVWARVLVARLPLSIAEREAAVLRERLDLAEEDVTVEEVRSAGPGNVVMVGVETDELTEVVTGFGERGVRAEAVAADVAKDVARYLEAGVPVGEHLADQLLVPMAMCGRGAFLTLEPTAHTRTNIEVVRQFLPVEVECRETEAGAWRVEVT